MKRNTIHECVMTHISTHKHKCTRTYTHKCAHTHTHTHTHTHAHTHTNTHTYIHTQIVINVGHWPLNAKWNFSVISSFHVYKLNTYQNVAYVYICASVHLYIYTCTYTYMYMYTRIRVVK